MSIRSRRRAQSKTILRAPVTSWWQCGNSLSRSSVFVVFLILTVASSCQRQYVSLRAIVGAIPPTSGAKPLPPNASPLQKQFVDAAVEQSRVTTGYDPAYVKIEL